MVGCLSRYLFSIGLTTRKDASLAAFSSTVTTKKLLLIWHLLLKTVNFHPSALNFQLFSHTAYTKKNQFLGLENWKADLCRNAEMYPECVIASWDALTLLLDAENIEWRVQLDAEKKIKCLCKLQTPGKNSITRYANLCFVETIFINWLTLQSRSISLSIFRLQAKSQCFLITFLSR